LFSSERCIAHWNGESHSLTAEQTDNASLIAAVGLQRGLPEYAVIIALATAVQESDLRNLDYGDRDSLGLFQQRPSQGWGTPAEVTDPHYATHAFYTALERVEGWAEMDVTVAAQAVQRSAFPDAYADHEAEARAWAAALTGNSAPGSLSCTLPPAVPMPDAADSLHARTERHFGAQVATEIRDIPTMSTVVVLTPSDQSWGGAVAHWAVASASTNAIIRVEWCGYLWERDTGAWKVGQSTVPAPCDFAQVQVTVTEPVNS